MPSLGLLFLLAVAIWGVVIYDFQDVAHDEPECGTRFAMLIVFGLVIGAILRGINWLQNQLRA